MPQPPFPVSSCSTAAIARVQDFERQILTYGPDAGRIFEALEADPACALARGYAALAHVLRQTREGLARASALLDGLSDRDVTPRDTLMIGAIRCWAAEDPAGARARLAALIAAHPDDLFAAKLLQLLHFGEGDAAGMLAVIERVLPHHLRTAEAHGMHAFALDEVGRSRDAERAADRALALGPDPWAHHALAHVFERTGRARDGRDWMRAHAEDWRHCSSFLYTHNWWHAALFDIALGDHGSALALYEAHVWARRRDYCQDQINAVSLLARLELAGVDVGDRWAEVAQWIAPRAADGVDGFLDLHYAFALARAGRDGEVDALLRAAADRATLDAPRWRQLMPGAASGVVAFARGDHATAYAQLARVQPDLRLCGGSAVQRDLFGRLVAAARARLDWAA
jgi:tetratricopeptide (TPR) repeat protein